jgi:hypothetical protein
MDRFGMRVRVLRSFLCAFCAAATQAPSLGATLDDVPPKLRQQAGCMLDVLKTVPGVSDARLGISQSEGWTHPFLEYRAEEKARWVQPTRFDVQKPKGADNGHYTFIALLPGLVTEGEEVDAHVTREVVVRWREKCGVSAITLTT